MLDHVGIAISDFARARAFYAAALAPLGIELLREVTPEETGGTAAHAGFGATGKPFFWIGARAGAAFTPDGPRAHIAFSAANRAVVDAFYAAALAGGGRDNGAPGLRLHYHPNYYGAFVLDPDGHNVEAVCHAPV